MNIYIEKDGCSRRFSELAAIHRYLELNNHSFVKKPEQAELIIVATCAFKKKEENHSYDRIKALLKYNIKLLVYGCLPDIAPSRFKDFQGVDYLAPKDLSRIDTFFENHSVKFCDIETINIIPLDFKKDSLTTAVEKLRTEFEFTGEFFSRAKSYAEKKLKNRLDPQEKFSLFICKGCLGKCTYCAIKRSIGPLKSFQSEAIVNQFKDGLQSGYTDYVVLGDDVGAYGVDCDSSLPDLLQELNEETDSYISDNGSNVKNGASLGFHIEEIHPKWMIQYQKDFYKLGKSNRIKSVLCPVQSGNDRILELMCREHESKDIANVMTEFRKMAPVTKLSTQLIVGFPTETDDEFNDSLNLVKEIGFDTVTIFPYDQKEKTPASIIEPKVPDETIESRVRKALKFFKKNKISAHLSCQDQ